MTNDDYQLLDSGDGRKLEQFGPYVLSRPCAQAVWRPRLPANAWKNADGDFSREEGAGWNFHRSLPEHWRVEVGGVTFKISPTDFGHLGVFPEHQSVWRWMDKRVTNKLRVLNLFAYSGGATLALAKAGAEVCHLDASKKMVAWARENAGLNNLTEAPVRWIVDDAVKFLKREHRRERTYDGILLDPPSFGRGAKQELFKIDDHLRTLLELCLKVLSDRPRFLALTCHTPGYTPHVLHNLLDQHFDGRGQIDCGEMLLGGGDSVYPVPSGALACWEQ